MTQNPASQGVIDFIFFFGFENSNFEVGCRIADVIGGFITAQLHS